VAVPQNHAELVIIDTDIGDDIDDAFAIALALESPEVKILGITTAWGNTALRARLVGRLLQETGRTEIPIAVGIEKHRPDGDANLTQAKYAERGPQRKLPGAVEFLLGEIGKYPGEITLIAIGPETNLAAAIERDRETFRKLKRVVLMGGSVYRGYEGFAYPTEAETVCGMEYFLRCGGAEGIYVRGAALRDAARFDADSFAGIGKSKDFQQGDSADRCVDGFVSPVGV
jgi:hypothetical protein